ncbi:acetylserotonin O-methyltransferase 1 [Brachypodium distachyon]|uniref:O-methyltransferase domain-containing protein n=1 Tax=Brachypodium distachyon TaxID=15368 RepID=I1HHM5_BRADI|nr:acetylserotonin O-methyltransferase 1 [Brachypodium distachyon]XP_024314988.1 acetylserotonin O-methyltransferase 1 [Brachypodium distachyon]KQK05394.1 hypothetical protein BRADI_2g19850v3 [Brachypodium distachyon]|eukprot:XP_003568106.1 acetylserotonin O-methyltransferase 1 [Brachypodium distachyon]
MAVTGEEEDKELTMGTEDMLQGHAELCTHAFAYVRSMALKCAVELGIPDAIHRSQCGAATLGELAAMVALPPSRLPRLRRLMRVLAVSNFFTVDDTQQPDGPVYGLTRASRLLVTPPGSGSLSRLVSLMCDPNLAAPFFGMSAWFLTDDDDLRPARSSIFEMHHGADLWDMAARDPALSKSIGDGMDSDSRFIAEVLLLRTDGGGNHHAREVFDGVTSLVDVGGGTGAIASAVAAAFPHIQCTVLDLPHVVAEAPDDGAVRFVAGDMFEDVPPADAVLLKSVMHDWKDDECVRILRRCKEAIPTREAGGKVIIINMVVGSGKAGGEAMLEEAQVVYDLFLMVFEGREREEHEWEKIFLEAGFSGYKVMPVLGIRSIIEVYP